MTSADDATLWEQHAGWWQEHFTDGADAEYVQQILPLASVVLAGFDRVLDVGAGEGQVARALTAGGSRVLGVDPTLGQLRAAVERGGEPRYAAADAANLPFDDRSFDAVVACLVFEHIDPLEPALDEVARVLRPGGRFLLFLNHPLLQTPGSGWIEDHMSDPPDRYWRIGDYLVETSQVEEVAKGVFIPFVHRPLSRYVNALAARGLLVHEMHEPGPLQGGDDGPHYYAAATSIPRLLAVVCQLHSGP